MEDARALLNSLMGADRNVKAEQRKARSFKDDDICKDFLLGLCPHELFTSTKLDLGPCNKHHNEDFKDMFESAKDAASYRRKWRRRLDSKLRGMLSDVDRRIAINKQRMERERESGVGATEEQSKQLTLLREEVSEKLRQAEKAADDGKFDESRKIMSDTEATKRKIEDLENRSFEKYKKDHICHVCGLIIDGEEAEAMKTGRGWHINGKQHLGYSAIRQKLKDFENEDAEDRKNGVRSASPSPVKVPKVESKKRDRSRSKSERKVQKSEGKRRRSPSKSADRRTAKDERRRSRAKTKASRSRSAPRKAEKKESKRRASPSPQRRSKSRRKALSRKKKRSHSRKRKKGSPERKSASRSRSESRKKEPAKKRRRSPSKKKAKKIARASSDSGASSAPLPPEEKANAPEEKPPSPPPEKAGKPARKPAAELEKREKEEEEEEEDEEEDESSSKMKVPVRFFLGLRRSG